MGPARLELLGDAAFALLRPHEGEVLGEHDDLRAFGGRPRHELDGAREVLRHVVLARHLHHSHAKRVCHRISSATGYSRGVTGTRG